MAKSAKSRRLSRATARAPACVGNVGPGFDLIGHTIEGPGDTVTVSKIAEPEIRIERITGVTVDLPADAQRNTAGRALRSLCRAAGVDHGFAIDIEKGIPLGSGLGGSAASAVAALVAANHLLPEPLGRAALYPHALAGEAVATGGDAVGDNVGPMLTGGLALATNGVLRRLPVPAAWHSAVVHPAAAMIETRKARQVLTEPWPLEVITAHSAHLALLLLGCIEGDENLVRQGLRDVLIEPRRAPLVPHLPACQRAAAESGAMGCTISGAGPAVFAWFSHRQAAETGGRRMVEACAAEGLEAALYVSPVNGPAARVLSGFE